MLPLLRKVRWFLTLLGVVRTKEKDHKWRAELSATTSLKCIMCTTELTSDQAPFLLLEGRTKNTAWPNSSMRCLPPTVFNWLTFLTLTNENYFRYVILMSSRASGGQKWNEDAILLSKRLDIIMLTNPCCWGILTHWKSTRLEGCEVVRFPLTCMWRHHRYQYPGL